MPVYVFTGCFIFSYLSANSYGLGCADWKVRETFTRHWENVESPRAVVYATLLARYDPNPEVRRRAASIVRKQLCFSTGKWPHYPWIDMIADEPPYYWRQKIDQEMRNLYPDIEPNQTIAMHYLWLVKRHIPSDHWENMGLEYTPVYDWPAYRFATFLLCVDLYLRSGWSKQEIESLLEHMVSEEIKYRINRCMPSLVDVDDSTEP
jgi:hypothetical protein